MEVPLVANDRNLCPAGVSLVPVSQGGLFSQLLHGLALQHQQLELNPAHYRVGRLPQLLLQVYLPLTLQLEVSLVLPASAQFIEGGVVGGTAVDARPLLLMYPCLSIGTLVLQVLPAFGRLKGCSKHLGY